MNPHWQDFLARHHAFITGGIVQNFGDNPSEWAAISGNTVLCDLHQFGVLRVAGEDAQPFLQNLLSNDIREASLSKAQFSSLNSAKGRMLASFLIWRDNGDYLLQLPHGLIEPVRKKLGMYVLRAKVKISDASDEIISLGIAGSDAGSVLCEKFGGVPSEPFSVLTNPFGGILKIGETRFQFFSTPDQAEFLWATLSPHAKPVGSPLWD
jgi:folate-binding Fe-S cluster repair protein YgfZ